MGSIVRSVSMTPEESEFIDSYQLSPTQLLKEKIWEFKGALKTLVKDKIERMAKVIDDKTEYIEALEERNASLLKQLECEGCKNGDACERNPLSKKEDVLEKEKGGCPQK